MILANICQCIRLPLFQQITRNFRSLKFGSFCTAACTLAWSTIRMTTTICNMTLKSYWNSDLVWFFFIDLYILLKLNYVLQVKLTPIICLMNFINTKVGNRKSKPTFYSTFKTDIIKWAYFFWFPTFLLIIFIRQVIGVQKKTFLREFSFM